MAVHSNILVWKIPCMGNLEDDAGKDCRQEEKRTIEYEILYGITDSMDMSLSKLRGLVKEREAWHAAIHGVTKSRT